MNQAHLVAALQKAVKRLYKITLEPSEIIIDDNPRLGDFSFNIAFKLVKNIKKSPQEIAQEIAIELKNSKYEAKAVSGFVNVYLDPTHFGSLLESLIKEKNLGSVEIAGITGKKVQVEYLSANPTGPIHIGNARGIIGEVIANSLKKAGAIVETEYYVNDIGGQANKFADTLVYWYRVSLGEKIDFPEGGYPGDFYKELSAEVVKKLGKARFAKLDLPTLQEEFRRAGIDESMRLIGQTIGGLNVPFDSFVSQEKINKEVSPKVFKILKEGNQVIEKEGAKWFAAGAQDDDSEYVLARSDEGGTLTYFMDDIAYHWDKFYNRKFDIVIDVWGSNHYGHISRMQKALEAIGIEKSRLQIALYQYVRLKKGDQIEKMAKRKGTYVTADQVLSQVPSDVFKFFLLMRSLSSHLDFDFELARDTSEKNPVYYVKYAHARMAGILEKSANITAEPDFLLLTEKSETALIKELIRFPSVIKSVITTEGYPVHNLAFYVRDLATKFHSFYDQCRVIDEQNPVLSASRLALVKQTKRTLKVVLEELIGIEAPEKM
jgi:arginyl-tRNA synthetase